MHPTKNAFPEKNRIGIVAMLQDHLAETTDLMLQAKQAHWNIRGPTFIALHELFDKIAESTEEYVDLIAERIVQFGGIAEGTLKAVSQRSKMPEYPLSIYHGKDHVQALAHALAYYGERARSGISKADELKDKDTADILTEISRGVDKYLWFVEAHLPAEKSQPTEAR